MSYTTPPTSTPTIQQEINSMVDIFAANATAIGQRLLNNGLQGSGITSPRVGLTPLIQLVNTIIIPTLHSWEGGWSDHPSDSGGATMRGVILSTLNSNFDDIFIATNIGPVKAAAQRWNSNHPNWRKDAELGKQLLYILCGNTKVGGLFICKFLSSPSGRYPIAVMTEDPFLGFFFMECVWGTGSGVYLSQYANFDGLLRNYGWNSSPSSWVTTIAGLGDKTPEVATQAILYRYNHIMKISREGSKNNVFQKGWLRRLMNDNKSDLMMLVVINEKFNLNSDGAFQFTSQEAAHLNRKAEIYKQMILQLPD